MTITTTTIFKQFYTALLKDPVLQERLKAAINPESLSELAVELEKENGYSFTKEEVLAARVIVAAMRGEYVEWNLPATPFIASESAPSMTDYSSILLDGYLG